MAQRSPNLYCIDRFTYVQRETEKEGVGEGGVVEGKWWRYRLLNSYGKAASPGGEWSDCFIFYSLTLPKFKGLRRMKREAESKARQRETESESPLLCALV